MAMESRKKKSILGLMSTWAALGVPLSGTWVSAAWRERRCPWNSTTQRYTDAARIARSMVPIVANTAENCPVSYAVDDAVVSSSICVRVGANAQRESRQERDDDEEEQSGHQKKNVKATVFVFSCLLLLFFFSLFFSREQEGCRESQQ